MKFTPLLVIAGLLASCGGFVEASSVHKEKHHASSHDDQKDHHGKNHHGKRRGLQGQSFSNVEPVTPAPPMSGPSSARFVSPGSGIAGTSGGMGNTPAVPLLRRETIRHRRGGNLVQDNQNTSTEFNDRGGVAIWKNNIEVFIALEIGTPPKLVRAQLDTGSSISVIPGVECYFSSQDATKRCGGYLEVPYDKSASTTSVTLTGNKSVSFADGSILVGPVVRDNARLLRTASFPSGSYSSLPAGGLGTTGGALDNQYPAPNIPLTFVYVEEANEAAREGMADVGAILGLGPLAFVSNVAASDPSSPASSITPPEGIVGLLGGQRTFSLGIGLLPPRFFIGVPDLLRNEVRYTPMQQEASVRWSATYLMSLDYMTFGTTKTIRDVIATRSELTQVVLDTGTTMLLLPRRIFDRFFAVILEKMREIGFDREFVTSRLPISDIGEGHLSRWQFYRIRPHIPPLILALGENFFLNIPPKNLFMEAPCSMLAPTSNVISSSPTGDSCFGLAVAPTDSLADQHGDEQNGGVKSTAGTSEVVLLGDPFMSSVFVVFDNDAKRLGFWPTTPGRPLPGIVDEGILLAAWQSSAYGAAAASGRQGGGGGGDGGQVGHELQPEGPALENQDRFSFLMWGLFAILAVMLGVGLYRRFGGYLGFNTRQSSFDGR